MFNSHKANVVREASKQIISEIIAERFIGRVTIMDVTYDFDNQHYDVSVAHNELFDECTITAADLNTRLELNLLGVQKDLYSYTLKHLTQVMRE
ncbi:hypothetical protein VPHF86_0193 [Vibrio phage F86]